jgi:hypothetical protein
MTSSTAFPSTGAVQPIAVVVAGALGRMGAEVVKAVHHAPDCRLVGAIDTTPGKEGADVGLELGLGELEVAITADFEGSLCLASQAVRNDGPGNGAVLVDFTHPSVVYEHTRAAIAYGVHPVIGTTGLSPEQLGDLASFADKASMGGAVIPNFSVGMVLRLVNEMMLVTKVNTQAHQVFVQRGFGGSVIGDDYDEETYPIERYLPPLEVVNIVLRLAAAHYRDPDGRATANGLPTPKIPAGLRRERVR